MKIGKQFIDLKKIANEMFCYVCEGGELVHNANGLVGYKSNRVIKLYVNVQISYAGILHVDPPICGKFNVGPNLVNALHM